MPRLIGALLVVVLAGSLAGQTAAPHPRVSAEGNVVNSVTGEPMEGARVKLERFARQEEARYTKTDSKGHFQVSDLPAGPYTVTAEARGCTRSVIQAQVSSASPALRIALTPYGVISGQLTDPNGAPFPYTFITILAPRPSAAGSRNAYPLPDGKSELARRYAAAPDDRGEFTTIVEPGTYYLMVGDHGDRATWDHTYRNTFYPGVTDLTTAKAILVAPGQHVRADLRIVQSSGVRLTGAIIHPPLPPLDPGEHFHTSVVMRPVNDVTNTGPTGSATGSDHYEFQNVPPGKYNFMAVVSEYREGPELKPTPLFAMQQQVEIGANDMDLAIELTVLPEIAGTVTFDAGCAPAPLRITSFNYPWGQSPDVFTGPDGEFTISTKYPGRVELYQVLPAADGNSPVRLLSARLGDRDILRGGFEYPPAKPGPLSLTVSCPATRRLP